MKPIKSILICFTILVTFTVVTGCQTADNAPYQNVGPKATKSIVEDLTKSCGAELKTYCDGVIPGEGRIVQCLHGQHQNLSAKCSQGLIDATARVEQFDQGVGYAFIECDDDIQKHCGTVIPGDGRLLKCLVEEKRDMVSKRCSQAIKDVGLDLEYLELEH
jgi:Cysteine rich repeat